MGRRVITAAVALVAVTALVSGCARDVGDEPALTPVVEPPVILEAGVLTVGLDTSYPPFASAEDGQIVGLDADVAAALAETLGLRLEVVELGSDGYAEALLDDGVDVALGAIPITEAVLTDVSFAGSYLADGPAFFSATETTETIEALYGKRLGAQEGSEAYWRLQMLYGEDVVAGYPTLREAFQAETDGDLDLVAGDAVVGAYIGRDFPALRYIAQIGDAVPLGVAVAKEAGELEDAVRGALDTLAAGGVLDAIRAKWVGGLPALATPASDTTTDSAP